ncbi:hypothetical protein F5882DRAFT_408598 [Hyaloscypha sp. PMI_1271]|nr:hypothetical protein F5882DRAFT_408598 [Hyaloscypha sp. PMI_1271]
MAVSLILPFVLFNLQCVTKIPRRFRRTDICPYCVGKHVAAIVQGGPYPRPASSRDRSSFWLLDGRISPSPWGFNVLSALIESSHSSYSPRRIGALRRPPYMR